MHGRTRAWMGGHCGCCTALPHPASTPTSPPSIHPPSPPGSTTPTLQAAVADGRVEAVTVTVGTQRRAVLEAIAYGCFLREVESWVGGDYGVLTPLPGAAGSSGGGGALGV